MHILNYIIIACPASNQILRDKRRSKERKKERKKSPILEEKNEPIEIGQRVVYRIELAENNLKTIISNGFKDLKKTWTELEEK